ncbi:NADH oxidase [Baekduia alba]|uniref:FAD-dependent oxidoreductase n=1 Tax=Baekduia alba TaxID=2997333 RepID=UPI00234135F8|nr:FAD-dependent oxidoreductase [Baekduia alba]WCB93411.1 NADH oxidase [Baekduia alba]
MSTATATPMTFAGEGLYPRLFSPWALRNQEVKNHIIFPPTCPTWTDQGVLTDMATAYYEERAKHEVGLIIIGATHVHRDSLAAPLMTPQLFNDDNVEPLRAIADAVHAHGTKLAIQLWHSGMRGFPFPKQDPGYDLDASWHTVSPSAIPLGEFPGGGTPKELTDGEILDVIDAFGTAAERAARAGLDGVEFHLSHGYLAWQFLSPLYNHRTDRWGGSYENRLRFPIACMEKIREAVGPEMFMGYRINSTSFWPGDLEIDDIKQIVGDLEQRVDVDYVSVSAGVHHAFIHTPMEFEAGWEKGYARAVKDVSTKPVFLVGRITTPEDAERLLEEEQGDAICLARQMFADPEWGRKAREGRSEDIRRCVAANLCWRKASTGQRVQCVYNPTMGRESRWGAGTLTPVAEPRNVVVVGGGPSGLECARVAAARGHNVTVLEREADPGGHVRLQSLLPSRSEYGRIGTWLAEQAVKNGATIRTGTDVTEDNIAGLLDELRADKVVVATGASIAVDGFQGWTAEALPGHDTASLVGWDDVVTGRATPTGDVLVVDDVCDVVAPLTAVALANAGARVKIVTRWPMIGMDTILDVYLEWILPQVYRAGVEMVCDRFVKEIRGKETVLQNVHAPDDELVLPSDHLVMVTARRAEHALADLLAEQGVDVATIGCAVAPRGTYEAVFEGHREGRRI